MDQKHVQTQVPANERLWNMCVSQARAKFAKYPSPAASHWVHQEYIRHGGQFVSQKDRTATQKLLSKHIGKHAEAGKDEKADDDKKKGDK